MKRTMPRLSSPKSALAPSLCLAALFSAGCSISDPAPFSPKRIQQIQTEHVGDSTPHALDRLPSKLIPSYDDQVRPNRLPYLHQPTTRPGTPVVKMTLQEVIHRTVVNSLEVRVAGYDAAIDEQRVLEAEGRFDPTFFMNLQQQRDYPQGIGGGNLDPAKILTTQLETGFRQLMTGGGQIEISNQLNRTGAHINRDPVFNEASRAAPFWQNSTLIKITQPLLRDFGAETTLARITVARNDQRISELTWRDKLEKALADVEEAYWQLVLARRVVEIQEEYVTQAHDTYELLIRRITTGDANDLHVSQARQALEERIAALVNARARIEDISDQIKRLMSDPDYPVASPWLIVPSDAPLIDRIEFSLSDQVETALQNRLELLQQQYRVSSATTVVNAAKNNLLPQLNLQAQAGFQGLGTDFDNAIRSESNADFFTYILGFQFEVPIGNRQARAIYQRTLLARQQAIVQYRSLADQVTNEVKQATRKVETAWNRVVAQRRATFAAEEALAAINTFQDTGAPLTPEFVQLKLDRQQSLTNARLNEAEALSDYNVALSALEKAKGTILRYNNVATQEENGPMFYKRALIPTQEMIEDAKKGKR